jgi:hypothetical protein
MSDPILLPLSDERGWLFHCPGCGHGHVFLNDGRWTFDGKFDSPTFNPSLINYTDKRVQVCHLFVKAGQIQFLSDCTHALAGQTVPMVPV